MKLADTSYKILILLIFKNEVQIVCLDDKKG